jgi:predicted transcriptional regulator
MSKRANKVPSTPLPTEAELAILQVLWSSGPQTVREVHAALTDRQTGYTTALKQMQVMTEKGLLTRSERFRSHVYAAKQPQERTQQRLLTNLLQRAFAGSAKDLVLGALSARPISAAELTEIKALIQQFEREETKP